MIGTLTLIKPLDAPVVEALPVAPAIVPMSAPPAPSVTDSATLPNPMVAPSFPGQTLGKGGTPFGAMPVIYLQPLPIVFDGFEVGELYPYQPRSGDPDGLVPQIHIKAPRPGEDAIMPVPTGQQPTKPALPPQQPSISSLPPVSGKVAGVDLAKVPFWAWLVAAAVIGAKLLK